MATPAAWFWKWGWQRAEPQLTKDGNVSCWCCSVAKLCLTLCDPMDCGTPGFPVLHYLPEFSQTHVHWVSVMPSNHLILCRPLLLVPSIFPSIRVFSNESALCNRWPNYWSFSNSPSNEQSFQCSNQRNSLPLISFRIDWFDLLAVQGTFKSLLQHHSLKVWSLRSAFFMVQLLHPYMTTVKTIALTIRLFVGKMMSLLFNMLPRFVIAFLPRSKCLLISWLQLPPAVILEPKKIKSPTVSISPPSTSHEVMGPDAGNKTFSATEAWNVHYSLPKLAHRRRQWHPTPVLLPGKSHGRRSLVSCSPWGR